MFVPVQSKGMMFDLYGQPIPSMPGGLSPDAYADKRPRIPDAEHYSAAGLLPFRNKDGKLEVLLAREKPWNSFIQAYDPLAWNVFGGKRVVREERSFELTAVRCFLEAVGDVKGAPDQDALLRLMPSSFCVWYPLGKFVLIVAEVEDGSLDDFPQAFAASKEENGNGEFRILPSGVKKWNKQIDSLEWVAGSSLVPEAKFEVSDLLGNLLKVLPFIQVLQGTVDAAATWPKSLYVESTRQTSNPGKGKSKGGGKGKKGKSSQMNGYADPRLIQMYTGKGNMDMGHFTPVAPMQQMNMAPMNMAPMNMAPMGGMAPMQPMTMQMAPQMPMFRAPAPPAFQQGSEEMQRQMYGEQLYVLVLPLSPSPYLAQKITGMLLELPQNELMLNLTDYSELQRRVTEALEVLKEDGIAA